MNLGRRYSFSFRPSRNGCKPRRAPWPLVSVRANSHRDNPANIFGIKLPWGRPFYLAFNCPRFRDDSVTFPELGQPWHAQSDAADFNAGIIARRCLELLAQTEFTLSCTNSSYCLPFTVIPSDSSVKQIPSGGLGSSEITGKRSRVARKIWVASPTAKRLEAKKVPSL